LIHRACLAGSELKESYPLPKLPADLLKKLLRRRSREASVIMPAAKNRAHGTKSEDSYPSTCPLDRFAIRAPCGAHPAPVASRHASSSIIRSLANLLVTARRLLGAPTCCSTPTAATALPYVTGTKRLERYISADSIKERRWRCAESPSRALWPCGSSSRDQQLSLAHVRVLRYWNRTFARLRRKRC
jgi:hypothetical protein